MLNNEEFSAIVVEAHTQGKLVRAHVASATRLDIALDARVDAIEHVPIPQFSEAE